MKELSMKNRRARCIVAVLVSCLVALCVCAGCEAAPASSDAGSTAPQETPASAQYADARISYLGPEGTYTQEACERFFAGQGTLAPCETVADAVAALVAGDSDFAVIPQENTIGGPVTDYLDVVLDNEGVFVIGEVELPISQNLLVLPGAELSNIKTVYSHKQGIAQARDWLEENLPDAEVLEVSSTAEAARMVAEGGDASCAAIASVGCADVYGLEVLAADVQQNDSNKTRFYVLSLDEPDAQQADRLTFVATGPADALPALLNAVEKQGAQVVAVHDRPAKTELGIYRYIVECAGTENAYDAISKTEGFDFRYLGSFPVR